MQCGVLLVGDVLARTLRHNEEVVAVIDACRLLRRRNGQDVANGAVTLLVGIGAPSLELLDAGRRRSSALLCSCDSGRDENESESGCDTFYKH